MTVYEDPHAAGAARRPRPITDILNDIVRNISGLLRNEMALARAEASEKVNQAIGAVVTLLIGAVLLIPALVILLQAGVAWLETVDFSPPVAALIVGGATLLIGLVLTLIGWSKLKVDNLVPRRTLKQFQRDAQVAKEQVR